MEFQSLNYWTEQKLIYVVHPFKINTTWVRWLVYDSLIIASTLKFPVDYLYGCKAYCLFLVIRPEKLTDIDIVIWDKIFTNNDYRRRNV